VSVLTVLMIIALLLLLCCNAIDLCHVEQSVLQRRREVMDGAP
jgi:hypothetical protein